MIGDRFPEASFQSGGEAGGKFIFGVVFCGGGVVIDQILQKGHVCLCSRFSILPPRPSFPVWIPIFLFEM